MGYLNVLFKVRERQSKWSNLNAHSSEKGARKLTSLIISH